VPNFVSVATSVAELAHGENRVLIQSITHSVTHSLTRPAYSMTREPKLSLQKIFKKHLVRMSSVKAVVALAFGV